MAKKMSYTTRRQYNTENHGNRKYGKEDADRLRKIIREERISQAELARREGIGKTTITTLFERY